LRLSTIAPKLIAKFATKSFNTDSAQRTAREKPGRGAMEWKGLIMTEAEVYEFDLNGYIVYRNLIGDDDLARMNELIDSHASADADRFGFLELDPIFLRLMAHPRTLHILKTIIGPWLRHDHAYGIQMTSALEHQGEPARRATGGSGRTPVPMGLWKDVERTHRRHVCPRGRESRRWGFHRRARLTQGEPQ